MLLSSPMRSMTSAALCLRSPCFPPARFSWKESGRPLWLRRVLRLVGVIALVGTGLAVAPRAAFASSTICGTSAVPSGYVVIGYTYLGSCGSTAYGPNAKTIELPYDGITMCGTSPMPSGYVMTTYTTVGGCNLSGYSSPNAVTLRRL